MSYVKTKKNSGSMSKFFLLAFGISTSGLALAENTVDTDAGTNKTEIAVAADPKAEQVKQSKAKKSSAKQNEESPFRFVPLVTSTPLMGVGVGGAVSYLYDTDESSSKSQLRIGGQYSETDSYDVFIDNNAWFDGNSKNSRTTISLSNVNHEFSDASGDVGYNTVASFIKQTFVMKAFGDFYFGVPISYLDIAYNANNEAGEEFLDKNGIVDVSMGAVGLSMVYDTRKNKYYPQGSSLVNVSFMANPEALGAVDDFSSLTVDARHYTKGFKSQDVIAMQFYGQYASEKTPDTSLPTLSGKSMLRGFPGGQFKARYMSGVQAEYRYDVTGTRFKLTTFAGVANLAGGSYGFEGNSRDDDGWYSAAGVGVRYAIQEKTGIDLRLDLVRTSEDENSLYLKLNQAF